MNSAPDLSPEDAMSIIESSEKVHVEREGKEVEISLSQLAVGDVFKHSDMWWQLTTVRTLFGQLGNGHPFTWNKKWYEVERVRDERLAVVLTPNSPFGEKDYHTLPPPFMLNTSVDALDMKFARRSVT